MGYDEFIAETLALYPKFKVLPKASSTLMKVIDFFLKLITLWRQKYFMTTFTTTLGYVVYTPVGWDDVTETARLNILRHERVHMKQRKEKGSLWFSISYLLLPLPCVWAYYRMKYEMEAYEESMRATWTIRGKMLFTHEYRAKMIGHFTSAEYFWTWPWRGRIETWYDAFMAGLMKG